MGKLKKMSKDLHKLVLELQSIAKLAGVQSLVSWDQETYMPDGAIEARSEMGAELAAVIHQKMTLPAFESLLGDFVDLASGEVDSGLEAQTKVFVQEIYRDWKWSARLPTEFVREYSSLKSQSQHAWQEARHKNDFSHFSPFLKKTVEMTAKKALYIAPEKPVYETLLDEYEPGMTPGVLTPLFQGLREELVVLLGQIQAQKPLPFIDFGAFTYDKAQQLAVSRVLLEKIGFSFDRGRLDCSAHPFTTQFHPTDVRVTTRVSLTNLMDNISSTMHEGGHGLYEQGLDPAWFGTPRGLPASLGIHESQSRFWENHIGKSREFWEGCYPLLQTSFPVLQAHMSGDFYRSINQVKPSLIRVESDEVTYNLHILIRYEMEQLIFEDQVPIESLPRLWNQKYQDYLGILPPTDSQGILQDVHWSMGAFGYFPTYTLGNLYAAQIADHLTQTLPNYDGLVVSGDFRPILSWLSTHIFRSGRMKPAQELVKDLVGKPLAYTSFSSYLHKKYKEIYAF